MKKWILKAIVQKGISLFPNKHQLNYWFQKNITKGVQLSDAYLEDKLIHFQQHQQFFQTYGKGLHGKHFLELGTGWYPVIPICLFLNGVEKIHTVDISRLMTLDNARLVIRRLLELRADGSLQPYFAGLPERWETLEQLDQQPPTNLNALLQQLQIEYRVEDARQLSLPPDSLDGILSNNTFEHIYPDILEGILRRFQSLLKPQGLMSHFIDMSDHFAHLDSTITIYNFLRFSEGQWRRIDNSVQPQNRWRLPQYRALYQELQIPILAEENRPGSLEELQSVPVHADFRSMPAEQLAISHSYLLSTKPA